MSWGRLALDVAAMREQEIARPIRPQDPSALSRQVDSAIAWQQSGYSTDGMSLPPVFAVVRLIASTIDQLELTVENGTTPEWLRAPRRYGSELDAGDLVQWIVTSMALAGAAYLRCIRVGESWRVDAYHAGAVTVQASTTGVVSRRYFVGSEEVPAVPAVADHWQQGKTYVLHIPYLVTPQAPQGISPITAARESIFGYFAVERQAANLIDRGTYSGGRLETDQDITPATATRYQERWVVNRRNGDLPVLGAGLHYVNDLISPRDAQWLESRQFNSQQVAMMFGVPPDYLGMTASGGGSSLSYNNSQDNDTRYRRNCLEGFTTQTEDALTTLLPFGRGAAESQRVRFDWEGWTSAAGSDASTAVVS